MSTVGSLFRRSVKRGVNVSSSLTSVLAELAR